MSSLRGRRSDRGSAAVETVILVPALVALVVLGLATGRVSNSHGDVAAAAQHAARQISIARVPGDAVGAAEADARTTLQVGRPTCRSMTFTPVITEIEVTVDVSCAVDLSAATMLPIPGSLTVRDSATEAIDQRRENPTEFGISDKPDPTTSRAELR